MTRSKRRGYPYLNRWLKNFYRNIAGVEETTNFKHIKEDYSKSHEDINPKSITPLDPEPEVEPWTEEDDAWYMQGTADPHSYILVA
jgi:putative glutathione S-transferase